jgi:2,3,4,5-tetrahydropyridine-2,6-dicarboxylate N-succinyltransferase
MYINAGAWVDEGTMVDSHALVGSCAQIGKRVHLSAAAQIGGVLEPINASPVIIEDDVLVGGNTGVYEGTIVRKGAVLAPEPSSPAARPSSTSSTAQSSAPQTTCPSSSLKTQ